MSGVQSNTSGHITVPLGNPPPGTLSDAAAGNWVRRIAIALQETINGGGLNVALPVTLAAGVTTTTVIDARINVQSCLLFSPLSANAAATVPTLYVSLLTNGSAVLTHSNTGATDRNFSMAILG